MKMNIYIIVIIVCLIISAISCVPVPGPRIINNTDTIITVTIEVSEAIDDKQKLSPRIIPSSLNYNELQIE